MKEHELREYCKFCLSVNLSGGLFYYSKHSNTLKESRKVVCTNTGLLVGFQKYARLRTIFERKNNYRLGSEWKIA